MYAAQVTEISLPMSCNYTDKLSVFIYQDVSQYLQLPVLCIVKGITSQTKERERENQVNFIGQLSEEDLQSF